MAVQTKGNNQSQSRKKKKTGFGGGGGGGGTVNNIFRVIIGILLVVFCGLCLFGVINQRACMRETIKTEKELGEQVGNVMIDTIKNEDNSALEYNDDGIYLRGHTPKDDNVIQGQGEENNNNNNENNNENKEENK